jgi:hypothetical protein
MEVATLSIIDDEMTMRISGSRIAGAMFFLRENGEEREHEFHAVSLTPLH